MVTADQQDQPGYEVGYKRPPKDTQFKPGQRGNPKGRPRGSKNAKAIVAEALYEKIPVRKGEKTSKEQTLGIIAKTFARKAAQGDPKAAAVVINLATKSGVLGAGREDSGSSRGPEPMAAASDKRPSDKLVESVDLNLLSKDEQIELAQLAERVDLLGDVFRLGDDDLLRLKLIVGKGRGQIVEPQADDDLDQAA